MINHQVGPTFTTTREYTYLYVCLEMFSPIQNKRLPKSIVVKNHLNASQSVFQSFEPFNNHCLLLYNPTTLLFTSTSIQNEMYLFTYLQHTYREPKLLHKKPLLSHRNQLTLTLKAMDSSYMFQKALCQQKYQKHSWMCKLACLAIFRCLQTLDS